MKIYKNIEDASGLHKPVITVGTFDGLHIGHRKIVDRMLEIAGHTGGDTLVVTFHPHPRLVIYPDSRDLKFITTREQKYRLFEKYGIGHLLEIPFTREFAGISSQSFIRNVLVEKLHVRNLVIGYDHHFGRNREGNIASFRMLADEFGFGTEEVPAQLFRGVPVSSTKIRNAIMEGNIGLANEMLGYEYSITGDVVKGDGIGRKLGFPTANIDVACGNKLIAGNGVYACGVEWKGSVYTGMANIGLRPTTGRDEFSVEVHLFDFSAEIYGERITIHFIEKIREERKFDDLEGLKRQLEHDRMKVMGIVGK